MVSLIPTNNGLLLSTNQKRGESLWRDDGCYKLIFSLKGKMHYETSRNPLSLEENTFILFNPNDLHRQLKVDHKFLIELQPSFLNDVAYSILHANINLNFAHIVHKNRLMTQWVQFVDQFISFESANENNELDIFLEHSLAQLAIILVKEIAGTHLADLSVKQVQQINPAIYLVIERLKADFQYNWTLDEIASILDMNKYQFAHIFKEIIGISPYSWLQCYRIIRSQQLLIQTEKTITAISNHCGFSSVSVYNQLFKKLYGITPTTFRLKYR
jgi:AraC-like DNA-binding protein